MPCFSLLRPGLCWPQLGQIWSSLHVGPVIEPMLMEADYLLTHVLSTPVLGVTITHMQLTAGLGMGISDPIAYPM